MVKLGWEIKTCKVCKKHVSFTKSYGEISKVEEEIINFPKNRGKCSVLAKTEGIRNWGKVGKIFQDSEKF